MSIKGWIIEGDSIQDDMELGGRRISHKVFMQRALGVVDELPYRNGKDKLEVKDTELASSAPCCRTNSSFLVDAVAYTLAPFALAI